MTPLKVGIIGCGNISGIYLENLAKFSKTEVVAVADLDLVRAREVAQTHNVHALTVDQIMAEPSIELILNLTVPRAHAMVNLQALESKKHVYTEKPLAINKGGGVMTMMKVNDVLDRDGKAFLKVGCAPETFMGAGLQTCRQLIDDGLIGEPIGFNAFMMGHGPEGWHPSPDFFYQEGGGPLLDMGPYYLTALVTLLGPVKAVSAAHRVSFKERVIGSEPRKGAVIPVETPTHIIGLLEMEQGCIGQLTTSFDCWGSKFFNLEIYGTEGSLGLPDPNSFGGPVYYLKGGTWDWEEIPVTRPYSENSRGLGVLDMAYAIRTGRAHRASGSLGLHVLDVMSTILEAGERNIRLELSTTASRPAPLSATLPENDLDG